jgi:hypothetical protein
VLLLLLLQIMHLKNEVRTTLADYKSPTAVYVKGERCWNVETNVDIALPCATQVGTNRGSAGRIAPSPPPTWCILRSHNCAPLPSLPAKASTNVLSRLPESACSLQHGCSPSFHDSMRCTRTLP